MEYGLSETRGPGLEAGRWDTLAVFPWIAPVASSRPSALQTPGWLVPRPHKAMKVVGTHGWPFTGPAGGCRAPAGSAPQPSFES